MERSYLQEEWGYGRFDASTSYTKGVGSGAAFQALPIEGNGAGMPSRRRAGSQDETDWAGNLVRPNHRKAFANDQRIVSHLKPKDGYMMAGGEKDSSDAAGLDAYKRKRLSHMLRSSDGVIQCSPGGLSPSNWQSSYQEMIASKEDDKAESPSSRSQAENYNHFCVPRGGGNFDMNPLTTGQRRPGVSGLSEKPSRKFDVERADFVKALDIADIARSVKKGFGGKIPTHSTESRTENQVIGQKTLILENYKQNIPGCTYHSRR